VVVTRGKLLQILVKTGAFSVHFEGTFFFTDENDQQLSAQQLRPLNRDDIKSLISANQGTAEGLPLYAQVNKRNISISSESREYIECLWSEPQDVTITRIDFSNQDFTGIDFQGADLRGANLKNAVLWQAKLRGANLWNAMIEGAKLWRADFDSTTQFEGTNWGNYQLGEEKEELYDEATSTYRRLMIWHREKGLFAKEEYFHYREWWTWCQSLKQQKKYLSFAQYLILNWVFGYGISYRKVIRTVFLVVVGFALIYFLLPLYPDYGYVEFLKCLYFSAISFTALGYGAWVSTTGADLGWPKYIGVIEAFVGVFLLALFITTFTRRWTR